MTYIDSVVVFYERHELWCTLSVKLRDIILQVPLYLRGDYENIELWHDRSHHRRWVVHEFVLCLCMLEELVRRHRTNTQCDHAQPLPDVQCDVQAGVCGVWLRHHSLYYEVCSTMDALKLVFHIIPTDFIEYDSQAVNAWGETVQVASTTTEPTLALSSLSPALLHPAAPPYARWSVAADASAVAVVHGCDCGCGESNDGA